MLELVTHCAGGSLGASILLKNFEKALEKRLSTVEPVTYLLEQCVQDLERAHKNAWPHMSMSMQRQAIREQCPTGELDKDYLQQSLKYEQKMLAQGRRKVTLLKNSGIELVRQLDEYIVRMRDELHKKRVHAAHDKAIIKASIENQLVPRGLLKADKSMEFDRVAWVRSVRELLDKTFSLEKEAIEYRKKSDELMKENESTAVDAAANSQRLFTRHTARCRDCESLLKSSWKRVTLPCLR